MFLASGAWVFKGEFTLDRKSVLICKSQMLEALIVALCTSNAERAQSVENQGTEKELSEFLTHPQSRGGGIWPHKERS